MIGFLCANHPHLFLNYLFWKKTFPDDEISKIQKKGNYLLPEIQLLLILPIQSHHLLDFKPKVKQLSLTKFRFLYPIEFKIQTFMKHHLHDCTPILPMINILKIKNDFSKYL